MKRVFLVVIVIMLMSSLTGAQETSLVWEQGVSCGDYCGPQMRGNILVNPNRSNPVIIGSDWEIEMTESQHFTGRAHIPGTDTDLFYVTNRENNSVSAYNSESGELAWVFNPEARITSVYMTPLGLQVNVPTAEWNRLGGQDFVLVDYFSPDVIYTLKDYDLLGQDGSVLFSFAQYKWSLNLVVTTEGIVVRDTNQLDTPCFTYDEPSGKWVQTGETCHYPDDYGKLYFISQSGAEVLLEGVDTWLVSATYYGGLLNVHAPQYGETAGTLWVLSNRGELLRTLSYGLDEIKYRDISPDIYATSEETYEGKTKISFYLNNGTHINSYIDEKNIALPEVKDGAMWFKDQESLTIVSFATFEPIVEVIETEYAYLVTFFEQETYQVVPINGENSWGFRPDFDLTSTTISLHDGKNVVIVTAEGLTPIPNNHGHQVFWFNEGNIFVTSIVEDGNSEYPSYKPIETQLWSPDGSLIREYDLD